MRIAEEHPSNTPVFFLMFLADFAMSEKRGVRAGYGIVSKP
jgi:hypothetical protein